MADTALGDTVSHAAINLNHGLISSLYNPYAALPSMHTAYALVVAFAVTRYGHRISLRVAGAIYSPFVLLVIIATGNHFFFDAAVGALVAAASAAIALRATRTAPKADLVAFAQRAPATTTLDRAA
jgi:membrane-associated phospholipid phosphatase